jgi:hypothetical protein
MNIMLPDNLPSVGNARLPEVYSNAKVALQECVNIDECQSWANKAEAMASYARQANDEALHRMADRIQARAIRRAGELLQEIEPSSGRQKENGGAPPRFSRTQAARDAGLSDDQRKTALRVANVPAPEFEAVIESDNPPTVTALAEMGTVKKPLVDLGERQPHEFAEATRLIGLIAHIKRTGDPINIDLAIRGLSKQDRIGLSTAITVAEDWLHGVAVRVRRALNANEHQ